MGEVREHADNDVILVLAGNKCDVSQDEREISQTEGVTLAARLGLPFLETSALNATNVEQAFFALLLEVHKITKRKDIAPRENSTTLRPFSDLVQNKDADKKKSKKCCPVG